NGCREMIVAAGSTTVTTCTIGNRTMAYRRVGSGPPLVVLNGFVATKDDWDLTFLAHLASDHELVLLDHRGIGESPDDGDVFARRRRRPSVGGDGGMGARRSGARRAPGLVSGAHRHRRGGHRRPAGERARAGAGDFGILAGPVPELRTRLHGRSGPTPGAADR